MYSCDAKMNFQHHFSSLQCHVILQKSFWYADLVLKKHFVWISMMQTVMLLNVFVVIVHFFRILSTFFDQISVSLLNKSINLILTKKSFAEPRLLNSSVYFRTEFHNLGINEESIFIWTTVNDVPPKLTLVESTNVVFTALIFR